MNSRASSPLSKIPLRLAEIVNQMNTGDYTASSEAVLLTRNKKTGIVTISRFGRHTGLLEEAYALHNKQGKNALRNEAATLPI